MTPLARLLQVASSDEKHRLAALTGTTLNYLYQVAGCHREAPSAALAFAIEDASRIIAQESDGRLFVVTAREIATMCATAVFDTP